MAFLRCLFVLVALAGAVIGQVTFVDASATGAKDGTSWVDAFSDLQTALSATNQGEIWVAQGNYYPGALGQRLATFQLSNNVAIYGGFSGTETSLAQRDIQGNPTNLSGDIDQNDTYGAGLNWWQFGWTGSGGNSHHVVTGSGTDATAILDGVNVLAGRGDGPIVSGGAGLYVNVGSPTLRNCTFRYNTVGYGSSARLFDSNSVFENCVIKDGYTCNCGIGGWVSGIMVDGNSTVSFTDCDFLNHYYVSSQFQGNGAALNIGFNSHADLLRCKFIGNQTGNFYPFGGGTAYGAGVNALGSITADRCEFLDNFAHAGAGLTAWNDARITNCLFARNRAVPHPNGAGAPESGDYGAGLLTLGSNSSRIIEILNCTFVDNDCDKGAGAAFYGASTAIVRNSIFYHNVGPPPIPGEDIVPTVKRQIVGNYDIANCCIEGLFETIPGEDPPNPANFPGSIDTLPLFVDVANEDYHLQSASPCLEAGDNTALPAIFIVDLDESPRLVNTIDMGCYEKGPSFLPVFNYGSTLGTNGLIQTWTPAGGNINATTGTISVSGATPGGLGVFGLSLAPVDVLIFGFPLLVANDPINLINTGSFGYDFMGMLTIPNVSRQSPFLAGSYVFLQFFESSPIPKSSDGLAIGLVP